MEELAAAFALEALLPEERSAYVLHLAGCGMCREQLGQFQTIADLLPSALEEEGASLGLKERILALARTELESEAGQAPATPKEEGLSQRIWRWFAWLTPTPVRVSAALALVVVGLVVWNVTLQLRPDEQSDLRTEERKLIAAIAAGATVTQLSGFEAAPEASGTLVQPPEGVEAFLIVRNLPRLASNQEFHVWRITGDVPLNVGAFPAGDRSEQRLTLAANFSGADAIGVSIERKGSKPTKPTPGAIVLLAAL